MKTINANPNLSEMFQQFAQNEPVGAMALLAMGVAVVCFVLKDYI